MRRRPGDGFRLVELLVRGELGTKSVLVPEEELHPSPLWGEEAALLGCVARVPTKSWGGGGAQAPAWAVRILRAVPEGYRCALLERAGADEEFRLAALAVLDLSASWADGAERLVELARGCP